MVYKPTLSENILSFARTLREHHFLIGPGDVALGLRALEAVNLDKRAEVQTALRLVFAASPRERSQFDTLFKEFWHGGLLADEDVRPALNPPPKRQKLQSVSMLEWDQHAGTSDTVDTFAYSATETKAQGDAAVQTQQVEALERLVRRLTKQLATKPSRRYAPSYKGELLDIRRSMRRSLARGGELLDLSFKTRKLGKTRLVFVFDVSGSMMVYSHFLLQLAYAFVRQRHLGRSEVFGFSTELYRLTRHLQNGGVEEAIRAARLAMPGRSGGTRIGYCLAQLLETYAQVIDPKTVLIINSDGWDTGDLETLRRSMKTLHERCERVIWLNPLAGSPGYTPSASGMKTALPYTDVFAPSHNFASLEALTRRLMKAKR